LTEYLAFLLKSISDLSSLLLFPPFIETGKILIRGDAVAMVLSVEQDSEEWRKNGFFPPFSLLCSVHLFGIFLYQTYFSILSNKIRARLVPFFLEKKSVNTEKKSVKNHFLTLLIKIVKMARKQVRFSLHVFLLLAFLFFHSLLVIYSVLCVGHRALFVECGLFP